MKHYELTSRFSKHFLSLIDESARKVFGHLPVTTYRTGSKYLKQKPAAAIWAAYYDEDTAKGIRKINPGFQTELEERRLAALIKAKQAGKGPPKKGQGKRATKR